MVQPSARPLAIAAREPKRGRGGTLLPAQSRRHRPPPSAHPGCSFGIDVTQRPCTHPRCSVCTICSGSFDLQLAGSGRRAIHLTSDPAIYLAIYLSIYPSLCRPTRPSIYQSIYLSIPPGLAPSSVTAVASTSRRSRQRVTTTRPPPSGATHTACSAGPTASCSCAGSRRVRPARARSCPRSRLQPPTPPEAHACSGRPSGPERSALATWMPKKGARPKPAMPPPLTPPSGEAYRTSKDALTEDEVGRIVEARGGGGGADSIVGLSNADGGALGGACPRQTDRQDWF